MFRYGSLFPAFAGFHKHPYGHSVKVINKPIFHQKDQVLLVPGISLPGTKFPVVHCLPFHHNLRSQKHYANPAVDDVAGPLVRVGVVIMVFSFLWPCFSF